MGGVEVQLLSHAGCFAPAKDRTPDRSGCAIVTVLTELSRLVLQALVCAVYCTGETDRCLGLLPLRLVFGQTCELCFVQVNKRILALLFPRLIYLATIHNGGARAKCLLDRCDHLPTTGVCLATRRTE